MIAITEAMRGVHITRRSTQQTLIEGEIGVQWPGVDSDSVSLLVISDMTSSQPRVGDGLDGGRINSHGRQRRKISRTSQHHCYYKKFPVSSRLVAHFETVETKNCSGKAGKPEASREGEGSARHRTQVTCNKRSVLLGTSSHCMA
jgi:hypothetical protein